MIPVPVPPEALAERGDDCDLVNMHPPQGVSDDDCGTAQMLLARQPFPGFTGRGQFAYFKPTAEDLAVLNAGGYLELCQIGRVVQPFALNVLPAGSKPPNEEAVADDATGLGDAGGPTAAADARDGADSHDVGPDAPETASAAEEGGVGQPSTHPAPSEVAG